MSLLSGSDIAIAVVGGLLGCFVIFSFGKLQDENETLQAELAEVRASLVTTQQQLAAQQDAATAREQALREAKDVADRRLALLEKASVEWCNTDLPPDVRRVFCSGTNGAPGSGASTDIPLGGNSRDGVDAKDQ